MRGTAALTEITGDGTIKSGPGELVSILLTAGSNAASLVLYDNTAASGDIVATIKVATAEDSNQWSPKVAVPFRTGLHADITGTGAAAYVAYH